MKNLSQIEDQVASLFREVDQNRDRLPQPIVSRFSRNLGSLLRTNSGMAMLNDGRTFVSNCVQAWGEVPETTEIQDTLRALNEALNLTWENRGSYNKAELEGARSNIIQQIIQFLGEDIDQFPQPTDHRQRSGRPRKRR